MSIGAFLLIFMGTALLSLPIAYSFLLTVAAPNLLVANFPFSMEMAYRAVVSGMNSFPLVAIPIFILAGEVMARGGISKALFDFFAYFIGNKRAGYPCAVIVTCLFYGAISGSGGATAAAVGSMTIPILTEMGYDLTFSSAIIAVSGGLGVVIPPSIPFIIYASTTGVSAGDQFICGILPGILIGLALMSYAYYYCRKNGEDRAKLEANYAALRSQGFLKIFLKSLPALMSPIIVLGSIYGGIASPTEAAAISLFYSLIVSIFVYKNIKIKEIPDAIISGVKNVSPILFIIATAVAFARVLTLMQIPNVVKTFILGTFHSKFIILLVITVILLIAGMFLDTIPAILILAPVFLPITNELGVNSLHLGVIMISNLAVGLVSPPVGMNLFVVSALTKVTVTDLIKKVIPFIVVDVIALLIIVYVPILSLFFVR